MYEITKFLQFIIILKQLKDKKQETVKRIIADNSVRKNTQKHNV